VPAIQALGEKLSPEEHKLGGGIPGEHERDRKAHAPRRPRPHSDCDNNRSTSGGRSFCARQECGSPNTLPGLTISSAVFALAVQQCYGSVLRPRILLRFTSMAAISPSGTDPRRL